MNKKVYYSFVVFFVLSFFIIMASSYFASDDLPSLANLPSHSIFGNEINIANIEHPYMLHFFASWCKACAIDHKTVLKYKKVLPMYGIASFDEDHKVKEYLIRHYNPYVDVIGDPFGKLAKNFRISAMPETLLIKKNKIIMRIRGPMELKTIEEKIIPLLNDF